MSRMKQSEMRGLPVKRKYVMRDTKIKCYLCFTGKVIEEMEGVYYCDVCGYLDSRHIEVLLRERNEVER